MEKIQVQVTNLSRNPLPEYGSSFASGVDLMANVPGEDAFIIIPGQRRLIPTGLYVAIPEGYEIQIRPRSGFALKKGITVLNTPGTIDSDYRGEIGVILINHSNETIKITNGLKIAQAVLCPVVQFTWIPITNKELLPNSDRGEGGFGSTDNKIASPSDIPV